MIRMSPRSALSWFVQHGAAFAILLGTLAGQAATPDAAGRYCGTEGVWVQILGSGGGELDDRRAGVSYAVWVDGVARVLVDAGPGASIRFDEGGGKLEDIDVVLFSQLQPGHTADLIDYIAGAQLGPTEHLLLGLSVFVLATRALIPALR